MGKSFFTLEDAKISFSLFCCVYGIGTLGMPGNYSRAGPYLATTAMVFMAFANIYASVVCSRVLLGAPRTVKTYGDLGEWCMGSFGRYLVVLAQMATCLLLPCAFLVLGGTLLVDLFPDTLNSSVWIVFMAASLLPICLTPTLKEGASAAFAGCAGTIIADAIGLSILLYGMQGHPSVPKPDLSFKQVAGAFGNLSLAYGAGIVIPALQRQHSDPTRMPRIIVVTLTFISCLFLTIATTGYSAVGCQIASNLLFTIFPDPATGLTDMGFRPHKGAVVVAFLFMQLHITIAFGVLVYPAFYILERLLLGMHKKKKSIAEGGHPDYPEHSTPSAAIITLEQPLERRLSKASVTSFADLEQTCDDEDSYDAELAEYSKPGNAIKYVLLRVSVVAVLVALAIAFKDHFREFTDVIGASSVTLTCIILPIVFYLKTNWEQVSWVEKILGCIVALICGFLGCYVTYTSGEELFSSTKSSVKFPFCSPEFETEVYYNASALNQPTTFGL
uniref:Amino Acid/Auxin Permease (AAAP) Family putative n=1 Tax=Albugo laibachii Nc14 TaxID=890382 RepID=F0WIW6_9STRA|nr:Amino Acid/Auxin Permease (AAAP) Family putative [Albugo laibachii Nc14]|eukprot:CCA21212.1 Amino Acid/Auxin Permease (AAAP) Family putative [Albugo laibachii Nc14]